MKADIIGSNNIGTDNISTDNDLPQQTLPPELARVAGLVPRAFWMPKGGNSETDYEDAYAVATDCIAIADGATESSFARLWAQALTAGFVSDPSATIPVHTERLQAWTQPLQVEWHSRVPWTTLPWFAEDKARAGAFATLLAFKVNDERRVMNDEQNAVHSSLITHHSSFQVFAIGDSCLFQIRDGNVKMAFPLEASAQFDSTPPLLSSNPANNKRVWDNIVIGDGTLQAGDVLLFATDALARWFLVEVEADNRPWDTLCGLNGQEEFTAFITRLRHERAIRNDDVTLVIVDASDVSPTQDAQASALADVQTPAQTETLDAQSSAPTDASLPGSTETASDAPPQAVFAGTPDSEPARANSLDFLKEELA